MAYTGTSFASIIGPEAAGFLPGPPEIIWDVPDVGEISRPTAGLRSDGPISSAAITTFAGARARTTGDDFFDRIIIFPNSVELGVLLSDTSVTIELFNSYRRVSRLVTSVVEAAGDGVSIGSISVPLFVAPLASIYPTIDVMLSGPAIIDGYVGFVTDVYEVDIPITGLRSLLLSHEPESPLKETLVFKTDVRTHRDGTETRTGFRMNPRQEYEVVWSLDGSDRRRLENVLFGTQSYVLGLPMWHESCRSTAAVGIGDDHVHVDSTAYADWRDGGIGVIWAGPRDYEVLNVATVAPTTVTFASNAVSAHTAGCRVMPVRATYAGAMISGRRYPKSVRQFNATLTVNEKGIDLASTSGWQIHGGKVILVEGNEIESVLEESLSRDMLIVDGEVGGLWQASDWTRSRRSSPKTFVAVSRAASWSLRRLLCALHGRLTSFYLPTFYDDLEPVEALTSGGTSVRVTNDGYSLFTDARTPRNAVRVVETNGTTIIRDVVSAMEIDEDVEQITVSAAWGANVPLASINRIEIVEKVRFDSDEIEIQHLDGIGTTRVSVPVKAVIE